MTTDELVGAAHKAESGRQERPLVSVIINNFNYARYLRMAIDSVLAQTYRNVELVVVDDGSQDSSPAVIRSYGERLRAIFKSNGGHGSCFNAGFKASGGDIVLFLDADDFYHPGAVEAVVEAFRSGAALVQFRLDVVDENGLVIGEAPDTSVLLDSGDVLPLLTSHGCYCCMVTSGLAFQRNVLEKLFPIPEAEYTQAADGYLVHSVPFLGPVAAIEVPLGAYRQHGMNNSKITRGNRVDIKQVRRRLEFTFREITMVKGKALERGISVARHLEMNHTGHLQHRIVSRRLDPPGHPFADDSPLRLGFFGARAALRDHKLRRARRVFLAGWFVLVALAPSALADLTIQSTMAPGSRPLWLKRLAAVVRRRAQRHNPL